MRLKKPTRVLIDQVRITREGNDAIIDYADAGIPGASHHGHRDHDGPRNRRVFNGILAAQRASWPPGTRRSSKSRRVRNKSTITKKSDNGFPAATCSLHHRRRRPRTGSHTISTTRSVAHRVRPDAQGPCGMGHADRIRARGSHSRESKGRSPEAQAASSVDAAKAQAGGRGIREAGKRGMPE